MGSQWRGSMGMWRGRGTRMCRGCRGSSGGQRGGGVQGLVPGMDAGEPSGGLGWEALHAGLGTQACEEGGGSVCIWALLPEADTHLDKCGGVGTEGGDREREVWGQVWSGEGGGEWEVAAPVSVGGGIAEGERWQGQEGDEAGYTAAAVLRDPGGGGAAVGAGLEQVAAVRAPCYVVGGGEAKRRRVDADVIGKEQGERMELPIGGVLVGTEAPPGALNKPAPFILARQVESSYF